MAALKNKKTSRKQTAAAIEPTPRHLWLASLGALVAVRRESTVVAQRLVAGVEAATGRIRTTARIAESDLRSGIADMRGQVQPKVMKFSSDVEARLAPVLDKLGLKPKARRAPRKARKTAAKQQPTIRRATRKPAKRAAKQAAT